jgi:DNA repair exonuclease SbcCD ATPase subunit
MYIVLLIQAQVRLRRQFAADCSAFDDAYQNCRAWCDDIADRLKPCMLTDGDRTAVESRLNRVNQLHEQRDDGFQRIQRVQELGARAISSSSAAGSDSINSCLTELAAIWDKTTSDMTVAKECLEAAIKERGEREALLSSTEKDLVDIEDELQQLDSPHSTLMEKVAQLERVKVRCCERMCTQ